MSFVGWATCEACGWTTEVEGETPYRLRAATYLAIGKHVCHVPPHPEGCEATSGEHRCIFAPYDHQFHECNCGEQFEVQA